ncbi:MAG: hypothetical protein IJG59_10265 [Erysipelotrichaceae bacterium]|nr:hypothetical protein [Erysipelotrichaceae bacterium]
MLVTLILSIIMMAALFLLLWGAVGFVQEKKFFTSAPKDIQAAVKEHSERFPGQKVLGWRMIAVSMIMFVVSFVYAGYDGLKNNFTFWQFFFRYLIMLYLLKAFDIIVFDWYLLTKSHFFQHYYPETEGCEGYHSFGFNRKEQLLRIAVYPFVSLLLAFICVLFKH